MENLPPFSRYCGISNNLYNPINSYAPLILKKMLISYTLFICTRNSKIIILLFVQQKCKHNGMVEMVFLTSRNANKHILLVLGVVSTVRDPVKVQGSIYVPQLHWSISPSFTRQSSECCRAC